MDPNTLTELSDLLPRFREADVRALIFTGGMDGFFIRHYSVVELDGAAQGERTNTTRRVSIHDLWAGDEA